MSASSPSISMENNTPYRISDLRTLYDTADGFSREGAEFRAEIVIPAYNELRYGGHHLLQAIDDSGSISSNEQLRRAVSHCERAMYEAAEAGIISMLDSIDQFRKDYENIVVKDVVDDYPSIVVQVRKAQGLLARGGPIKCRLQSERSVICKRLDNCAMLAKCLTPGATTSTPSCPNKCKTNGDSLSAAC